LARLVSLGCDEASAPRPRARSRARVVDVVETLCVCISHCEALWSLSEGQVKNADRERVARGGGGAAGRLAAAEHVRGTAAACAAPAPRRGAVHRAEPRGRCQRGARQGSYPLPRLAVRPPPCQARWPRAPPAGPCA
jgi:hypothetical protein